MAAISIDNLKIRFGQQVLAVDDFSLQVNEGDLVSIVGPSGCGKTTVLNQLTGLLPPQEGRISILGKPPHEGNADLAYMLARDCLLPWRTTLANACYGMELRGVPWAQAEARARELLAKVGLAGFEDSYPKALSHGMRQRCALARTFALDSPILLMDEPFGALDAQTKLALEDLLLSLWQAQRRTVIFITHDLGEAVALSDRVVVMSARPGRIIADVQIPLARPRSVRALQKSAEYHEIYTHVWEQLERGIQQSGAAAKLVH
ncbi:ABC transporter ATP-binding protein [Ramlibacter solisilvae]|uniref:ABC transporter ATP-binding protein n=1 Tax=Ramlibacter tataouinensis TaxID=94132 RepID=A0A127JUG8_9BURK|nr:ABC transporter ATP-binding protein [Ramlibacter tataouinensis]AMO23565.1 ABC transporter ATP-binding protein [Ramlibacter tataouinensis]